MPCGFSLCLLKTPKGRETLEIFADSAARFIPALPPTVTKSSLSIRPKRKSMTPLISGHCRSKWPMHPLRASAMERMIAPMSSTPFAPRIRPSVSSFRRAATTAPAPRDWSVRSLNEHGRMNWRTASGYHRRSKGEAAIGRSKRVSGGVASGENRGQGAQPDIGNRASNTRARHLIFTVRETVEANHHPCNKAAPCAVPSCRNERYVAIPACSQALSPIPRGSSTCRAAEPARITL